METKSAKRYRLKNRNKINKRNREYLKRLRSAVIWAFGAKCKICGFSDIRALQIDHVNGGGSKERKTLSHNSKKFYHAVLKSFMMRENKYQLLCANCNWIKRFENNE